MKMKLILTAALTIAAFNTFAADDNSKIPKKVLDQHIDSCPDFASAENGPYMRRQMNTLPDGNIFYLLGCEFFAYNSSERAYMQNSKGEISTVSVSEIQFDGSFKSTSNLIGATFDPDIKFLRTFEKGRGMGDCGASATYKYDASEGKFVLIEARAKKVCDGIETEWPIVYKK